MSRYRHTKVLAKFHRRCDKFPILVSFGTLDVWASLEASGGEAIPFQLPCLCYYFGEGPARYDDLPSSVRKPLTTFTTSFTSVYAEGLKLEGTPPPERQPD
jgi:hypothetical protein